MHCVLSHPLRCGERDPELWNVACDHAINLHLLDQGFILPDDGIHDKKYRDMTAEAIYNQLGDDDRPSKNKPMWGLVMDPGQGSMTPTSLVARTSPAIQAFPITLAMAYPLSSQTP